MSTNTYYFFDSHGGLWSTCDADHPKAQNFGPEVFAYEADPAEAGLDIQPGESAYSAAQRSGRLVKAEDNLSWNTLADEGTPCDVCGSTDTCCDDGPGGDWSLCRDHCDIDHKPPAPGVVYYPQG